ncbi:MAG: hypothetical protein ABEJ60_06195, partial [Halodesulfurarchaeum sp.]
MSGPTGEDRNRRRLAGSAIATLGAVLAIVLGSAALPVSLPASVLLLPGILLALALVAVGWATVRGMVVEERDTVRFAAWVGVGTALFELTGAWIGYLQIVTARTLPAMVPLGASIAALGGSPGETGAVLRFAVTA